MSKRTLQHHLSHPNLPLPKGGSAVPLRLLRAKMLSGPFLSLVTSYHFRTDSDHIHQQKKDSAPGVRFLRPGSFHLSVPLSTILGNKHPTSRAVRASQLAARFPFGFLDSASSGRLGCHGAWARREGGAHHSSPGRTASCQSDTHGEYNSQVSSTL